MREVLTMCASKHTSPNSALIKDDLKQIPLLAQSDREREIVQYVAFRILGLSASGVRRHFGLDNMTQHLAKVEQCIEEAKSIHKSIDELARIQKQAGSRFVGLATCISSSDSECEPDSEGVLESDEISNTAFSVESEGILTLEQLKGILTVSSFNWLEVVEATKLATDQDGQEVELQLEKHFSALMACNISQEEKGFWSSPLNLSLLTGKHSS